MMSSKRIYAMLIAASACLSPAMAQSEQTATQSPGELSARYAACLAVERPSVADIFIAASPGSPERSYAFNALVPVEDNECARFATAPDGQQLEIPEIILTGNIAEARYIIRFPDGAPQNIASNVPVGMADEEITARLAAAPDPAVEFPRIFGDCIVRQRAPDVDRLVRTRPGSPEEAAVLSALQPSLGSCLWSGQTLELNRETLRASLADALYRRGLVSSLTDTDTETEAPSETEQ